jgi:hypothetical protein
MGTRSFHSVPEGSQFLYLDTIVIYEPSAGRHFSHMSALFEAQATKQRVLHLRECAEYVLAHLGLYNIF